MKNDVVVAKAIRIEVDTVNNDMYLVFKVLEKSFGERVRENWGQDIPVILQGKDLLLAKE